MHMAMQPKHLPPSIKMRQNAKNAAEAPNCKDMPYNMCRIVWTVQSAAAAQRYACRPLKVQALPAECPLVDFALQCPRKGRPKDSSSMMTSGAGRPMSWMASRPPSQSAPFMVS